MRKAKLELFIGQEFGHLTVTDLKTASPLKVRCRCACGKDVEVNKSNLRSGRTQSCGCHMYRFRAQDFKGKQHGNLVVQEALRQRDGDGCVIWLCQCVCGRKIELSSRQLVRRKISSCGCESRYRFIGQRFGQLRVLRFVGREKGAQVWECVCDCGNTKNINQRNLVSGHTKSCGCLNKKDYRLMAEGTCIDVLASSKLSVNNTSGYKGVSQTPRGTWVAYLTLCGKRHHLGTYHKLEDAVERRKAAEEELYYPLLEKYSRAPLEEKEV